MPNLKHLKGCKRLSDDIVNDKLEYVIKDLWIDIEYKDLLWSFLFYFMFQIKY